MVLAQSFAKYVRMRAAGTNRLGQGTMYAACSCCETEVLGTSCIVNMWIGGRESTILMWTVTSPPFASGLQALKTMRRRQMVRKSH